MGVWANQEVYESTVGATPVVHTLARRSRAIEIINDSGTRDLQYKFSAGETYATLKPLEVISIEFRTPEIYLDQPDNVNVSYRIRVLG